MRTQLVIVAFAALVGVVPAASMAEPLTLRERTAARGGVHFQVAFGWAGGPTSNGLLHNMELGGTFSESGLTIAYDHVWVLSDGLGKPDGGSDMFGGHMLLFKLPLGHPALVGKLAAGIGENVDLSEGFSPRFGVGWLYGLDVHLPFWPLASRAAAPTLGIVAFHAVTSDVGHQWAGGVFLGYTWR